MNRFVNVMKIYIRAAFFPPVVIFSLIFALVMPAVFIFDPEPRGSSGYSKMMICLSFAHMFFMTLNIIGFRDIMIYKFFASVPGAKKLYTVAPVVAVLVPCLIYDIIFTLVMLKLQGEAVASDVIIFGASGSMISCIFAVVVEKKNVIRLDAIIGVILSSIFLISDLGLLKNGFGLSLYTAAAIGAGIFLFTAVISVLILRSWWRKEGRINPELKARRQGG